MIDYVDMKEALRISVGHVLTVTESLPGLLDERVAWQVDAVSPCRSVLQCTVQRGSGSWKTAKRTARIDFDAATVETQGLSYPLRLISVE